MQANIKTCKGVPNISSSYMEGSELQLCFPFWRNWMLSEEGLGSFSITCCVWDSGELAVPKGTGQRQGWADEAMGVEPGPFPCCEIDGRTCMTYRLSSSYQFHETAQVCKMSFLLVICEHMKCLPSIFSDLSRRLSQHTAPIPEGDGI